MKTTRFRDLTLLQLRGSSLLIACDSIGGIGDKSGDVLAVEPETVGYFLCRVPLMELLSQGVEPGAVIVTLSTEREPTGRRIYHGVAKALVETGLDPGSILNGSTEENIPTVQTGAGITLIGEAPKDFRFSSSPAGAKIYVLGIPKVAEEVLADKGEIVPLGMMPSLYAREGILEILPVGSRGCLYEAGELARTSSLTFVPSEDLPPWAESSAGPACCILVSVLEPEALEGVQIPIHLLGELK